MEKTDNKQQSFIAPCRNLTIGMPVRWLKMGFNDICKSPIPSMFYGGVMALMFMTMIVFLWQQQQAWLILILLTICVFLTPLACIGIYAVSAQLERGEKVSLLRTFRACLQRYIGNEMVFVLVMLIIVLVWARANSAMSIFFPNNGSQSIEQIQLYVALILILSLVFMGLIFMASIFSLPMIMHRDVDAITAILTSVNAVLRNKLVMMLWALIISIALVIGILSAGSLLIVMLPMIGHAVWHGYQDAIDADGYDRHAYGITAIPKSIRKVKNAKRLDD